MLIVGAGGLAIEVLEILHERNLVGAIYFYDDVNLHIPNSFHGFPVINHLDAAAKVLEANPDFVVAVGDPVQRKILHQKFIALGGKPQTLVSNRAVFGHYETVIGEGSIIMATVFISNGVKIGKGVLVNPHCTISHGVTIGDFSSIAPGVQVTGNASVGAGSSLGAGSVVLPKIKIGDGGVVGAGAVVNSEVPQNTTVAGVPAKPLQEFKKDPDLSF